MSLIKAPRKHRILIVDDLPYQRTEMKSVISKVTPECEFVEAGDFTRAKAILEEEILPFDLAIIDVRLGSTEQGKDGHVLAQQIMEKSPQTGVIVVTAYPGTEAEWPDRELPGEHSFISKLERDLTKKLKTDAKRLLERGNIRQNLRLQHDALEDAYKAFRKHEDEWIEKYAGRFIFVVDGEVVESAVDASVLQEAMRKHPVALRCKGSVIKVPFRQGEGNRD